MNETYPTWRLRQAALAQDHFVASDFFDGNELDANDFAFLEQVREGHGATHFEPRWS